MRREERLNAAAAAPPRPPRSLLGRYLERRNRYIAERRLPRFTERPIDWTTDVLHTLLYRLAFAHVGKLTVIAAYYLLTQTMTGQHVKVGGSNLVLPDVKGLWDHLLSRSTAHGGLVHVFSQHAWNPIRHLIRAAYEGIFGILLFKQIGYSVLRAQAKDKSEPSGVDRFVTRWLPFVANRHQGHPITPLQYLSLPLVVTVAALPGMAIGYGIVQLLHAVSHAHWLRPTLGAHPSFAARFYADDFDAVLVGIFAGLTRFVSYVMNPVLHSNTVYFARRRVAKGRTGAWWHPPAYRRFVDDLARHPDGQRRAQAALDARSSVASFFLVGGWVVVFGLAAYGYYVIRYIA